MKMYNYRPAKIEDVVGNEKDIDIIKNLLDSNIMHRHILITGETGIGKTTIARNIAARLLKCDSERILRGESNMNYYEISCPKFNKVDFIKKRVGEIVYYAVNRDECRIFFFDECASLTLEAQRVLLKIIEDSYACNYFIFATNDAGKLDEALVDRLYPVKLEKLNKDDIFKHLKRINDMEKFNINEKILVGIAIESGFKPRRAEQLLAVHLASPEYRKNLPGNLSGGASQGITPDNLGDSGAA